MVNQCVKYCITKHVICWEKPNFQRMVRAKLFWKDGTQMRTIKVIVWWRLDRRENQTIRRTCPGRPFLSSYTWREGTMAKLLETFVLNKGVQGPTRQRPKFREAKHACRRLYKEHVESTGQGNKSRHQHNKEGKILNNNLMNTRNTPKRFTLELDGYIILQQVRTKLGSLAIFNLDWTVTISRSKSSAQGNLSHCWTTQ